MVALVTLDQVKQHLKVDTEDDDEVLDAYIRAASQIVVRYLKSQAATWLDLDDDGELVDGSTVPTDIEIATIILIGHFYREPDGDTQKAFDVGWLPRAVTTLLHPLRDPALA